MRNYDDLLEKAEEYLDDRRATYRRLVEEMVKQTAPPEKEDDKKD